MSRCRSSDHFLAVRAISFRETAKGDVPPQSNSVNWVPHAPANPAARTEESIGRFDCERSFREFLRNPTNRQVNTVPQFEAGGDPSAVGTATFGDGVATSLDVVCNSDNNSARRAATSASKDVNTSIALSRDVAKPITRY